MAALRNTQAGVRALRLDHLLRFRLALPVILLLCAALSASVPLFQTGSVERLPNGNTLIDDLGYRDTSTARVIEVDSLCRLRWAYVRGDIEWSHTARRLPSGNTLISATSYDRAVEVNPKGNMVWWMASGLNYPNEAYRLSNGNTLITDRDNNRVIEVDSARNIVWSYTNLLGPHNGNRLANGNTLISDSDNNRVLEVDSSGNIVWQYSTNLDWPRSGQRLANGNTLITDSYDNRVIEVDSAGKIVWSLNSVQYTPYEAVRLPNGHTLVSIQTGARVIEVDSAKNVVWQYPPTSAVVVETLWVVNPTSECSLYVHIHRPVYAGPTAQVPGVVLVPDSNGAGAVFDADSLADDIASDGFAVLHFDADGRGLSSGTENYDGYVHQDGLAACAAVLAARPYVDSTNLGIYSRGYGVVMATGMIARHSEPNIEFLMDFEGPSDRYQCSKDSGGPIPYPVDSAAFWQQREAGRFIKSVPGAYLRIQTAVDHTGRILDNRHAIALIDSATATKYGGSGMSVWTRVNDSVMNPENHIYAVSNPPVWIPEPQEYNEVCRDILYLHELTGTEQVPGVTTEHRELVPSSSLRVAPRPCRGVLQVSLPLCTGARQLRVHDVCGRLVRETAVPAGRSSASLDMRGLQPGVYYVSAAGAGTVPVAVVR